MPRAIVVSVDDQHWTEAIDALCGVAQFVVIDISRPTASLLWELRHAVEREDCALLLLGDETLVTGWLGQPARRADPIIDEFRRLTHGRAFFALEAAGARGIKSLRQALWATLNSVDVPRPRRAWLWDALGLLIWPTVFIGSMALVGYLFQALEALVPPWADKWCTSRRGQARTKSRRSSLSWSLCVSASPCGASAYTSSFECLTSLAAARAEGPIGTI
jgi:hypothetical protein